MKKLYLLMMCIGSVALADAQCTVTATSTNVTCNGLCNGTANATAIGVPPYNYLWQPGNMTTQNVSNLCAGTYSLTVVDGTSCVSNTTVTITQPSVLTATSTQVAPTCNGNCNGSATAFPSGGTAPYTHRWSTAPVQTSATATGLCAGTYMDTIKDNNGCIFIMGPVNIVQPGVLAASFTAGSVSCNGDSTGVANAQANGGTAPYTYSWSTNPVQTTSSATGLAAGTYTCLITDANNCTYTGTCTVNQPSALSVASVSADASCPTCCDGSSAAAVTGGVSPYTYSWSPSGQTGQTMTGACAGNYTVCVTDANGCMQCSPVSVNFSSGLAEYELSSFIQLFPNPTSGLFVVNTSEPGLQQGELAVYNMLGEKREVIPFSSGSVKMDLSDQPDGVYFVTIITPHATASKRLLIHH